MNKNINSVSLGQERLAQKKIPSGSNRAGEAIITTPTAQGSSKQSQSTPRPPAPPPKLPHPSRNTQTHRMPSCIYTSTTNRTAPCAVSSPSHPIPSSPRNANPRNVMASHIHTHRTHESVLHKPRQPAKPTAACACQQAAAVRSCAGRAGWTTPPPPPRRPRSPLRRRGDRRHRPRLPGQTRLAAPIFYLEPPCLPCRPSTPGPAGGCRKEGRRARTKNT